jgi:hypothetical protein
VMMMLKWWWWDDDENTGTVNLWWENIGL